MFDSAHARPKALALLLLATACTPPQTQLAPETSAPTHSTKAAPAVAASPFEFSWAEIKSWHPLSDAPFPSTGHPIANETLIWVRVSPNAEASYRELSPGSTLPAKTVILAAHRTGERELDAFVMEKRTPERWTFLRVTPNGKRVPANAELCRACHADGVADSLFGPPRPSAP